MKKTTGILWGIALIAAGVILGGNALGFFELSLFFDGWWTLFIIIPCIAGLFTDEDKTGSLIGLIIGVFLLMVCQGVVGFDFLWKILLPAVVIIAGLAMIFRSVFGGKVDAAVKTLNEKIEDDASGAIFGGQDIDMSGKEFKGKNVNAVFGGLKLDLRKAKIKEDVVINASAVFGGIEIWLPEDVVVEVKSNSAFGGISNKRNVTPKKDAVTVYINGTTIFGGIEIK